VRELARLLDPATREALLLRIRFYRDLGLTEFYRRPVDTSQETNLGAPSFPLLSAERVGYHDPCVLCKAIMSSRNLH